MVASLKTVHTMTTTTRAAQTGPRGAPTPLTVGVEEEFLLVDPETGENLPVAENVRASLPRRVRKRSHAEVRRSIVEMVTPVCADLAAVRRHLLASRRAAAKASVESGARLVAVGATPVRELEPAVVAEPRYRAMEVRYGPVALDPAVCGLHVHVGVPDRELAVQVCNHVSIWLPVVQAMTANSPIYEGHDTGHASWRSVQLTRWPGLGPTPRFESVDDYDNTVAALVMSGALLDPAMVYWYARLSASYPTVEVRVGDVCPTVDDTVLVTALIRALVGSAIDQVRAGTPPHSVRECLLTAAHWRAAHDGLGGMLVDLRLGRLRPAWDLVNEFFATVSPALLRSGDLDLVLDGLNRLRQHSDGAARQRAIHRGAGDVRAVLAYLAERTVAG